MKSSPESCNKLKFYVIMSVLNYFNEDITITEISANPHLKKYQLYNDDLSLKLSFGMHFILAGFTMDTSLLTENTIILTPSLIEYLF